MILDQFKNSVPERIATYISEQKVKTHVLTHGGGSGCLGSLFGH